MSHRFSLVSGLVWNLNVKCWVSDPYHDRIKDSSKSNLDMGFWWIRGETSHKLVHTLWILYRNTARTARAVVPWIHDTDDTCHGFFFKFFFPPLSTISVTPLSTGSKFIVLQKKKKPKTTEVFTPDEVSPLGEGMIKGLWYVSPQEKSWSKNYASEVSPWGEVLAKGLWYNS